MASENPQHDPPPIENEAKGDVPKAVIKRLSLYSRVLQRLERNKVEKVSSSQLGKELGINSAQVRKDLATFGQFGVPGFGYPVSDLRARIKIILGTDRQIRVALIGVGRLGAALLSYPGFSREGFYIQFGFDLHPEPGAMVNGVPIHPMDSLEELVEKCGMDFAILTVPADVAQQVADRLVKCGISGILNFVPVRLKTPDHVKVHYVDLALEMESLSFYIK